ncbi:VanW family protein [Ruminococcaceae bacterium OttesenSCG-928-D13]|nr:VanW family protein [Ruminococcaceae bacterium OttesenSCG-928-D13]
MAMAAPVEKPASRGALRLKLGSLYFTGKRYLRWLFGGINYAERPKAREDILPFTVATHATPLLRKLKAVDMALQYNKITNLRLAAARLNGVILEPGQTFSYWKLIGKPTRRKGYLEGMVLQSGTVRAGIGGGLCQLSNLAYWLTIHTPLTVVERYRHGYDVFPDSNRTQPFGSGATCFYNYGDLAIKNNTLDRWQLNVRVTETELEAEWRCSRRPDYSYQVYEKEHLLRGEAWGGYTRHNLLHRKKLSPDGTLLADEFVVENHAIMMYQPFLHAPSSPKE